MDNPLARWLDPDIRAFIARTDAFFPPSANMLGIADSRRRYDAMCLDFRAAMPAGVAVADAVLHLPGASVPTRRYTPAGPARPAALLYLHGGGFVLGGLDSHHDVCAELCASGMNVVAVAYRLAPEHVYPAALDDAYAVYQSLAREQPVVVAGDSAGANLAAALCHRLRRLGQKQPRGQVLIYPGLSADPLRVAGSRAATAPMLTASDGLYYAQVYAGGANRRPTTDPEFSPLSATDFTALAPAALFAAGYDPLCQDAEDYAAVLHAAGVPVTYRCDPGLVHGWLRGRHTSRLAAQAFAAVADAAGMLAEGALPD